MEGKPVEDQMNEMAERLSEKFEDGVPLCFSFVISDEENGFGTALATIESKKNQGSLEEARQEINNPESNVPALVLRMFNTALESYLAKTIEEEENERTV